MDKCVKDRVNCYVDKSVKDYINSQCEFYGISIGAFLSMVVMQHKQQNEVSSSLVELQKMISDIKELEISKQSK